MRIQVALFLWPVLATVHSNEGDKCLKEPQCKRLHVDLECVVFGSDGHKTCRCKKGLAWKGNTCQAQAAAPHSISKTELLTILVPVSLATTITLVVALVCCFWANKSAVNMKKEYKIALRRESAFDMDQAYEMATFQNESETEKRRKSNSADQVVNQTSLGEKLHEQQMKEPEKSSKTNGFIPNVDVQPSEGYRLNIKRLLAQPEGTTTSSLINNTRPTSSISYTIGRRPYSAMKFHGPSWLRSRPNSAAAAFGDDGRKSYRGPYLTDPSMLPPTHLRGSSKDVQELSNAIELVDLYDKISEVEKKRTEEVEQKEAKESPADNSPAKYSGRRKSSQQVEEIRLVRAAASAFKRRRRMKDVVTGTSKYGGNKTDMETVAEKIMKRRHDDGVKAKPKRESSSSSSTPRTPTRLDKSERSNSSNRRDSNSIRPQSVAQRILRERQEQNLKTRFLVDEADKKGRRESSVRQQTLPLHLALRQKASTHCPITQTTQKIKEEARLDVVNNLSFPEVKYEPMPGSAQLPARPILKKSSSKDSDDGSVKSGRVNFAFEQESIAASAPGVQAEEMSRMHKVTAEVH